MERSIQNNIVNRMGLLVGFKTVSAHKEEFYRTEMVKSLLSIKEDALKFDHKFYYREIEHNGSPSLIIGTTDTMEPDISLSAHIDVAPAAEDMFDMKITDDRAYGRGVADMKFAAAVYLEVLKEMKLGKNSPSVSMIITSDEEVGSFNGAKYIAEELGYRPKLMFVPDGGGNWCLVQKAKGALQIKVEAAGKSAHASRPWEGESANDKMVNFLITMRRQYPDISKNDWEAITMNIGIVNGGQSANQVADHSEAVLDFRFPFEKIKEQIIRDVINNVSDGETVTYPAEAYCFDVDLTNFEVRRFIDIVEQTTDGKVKTINEFGATDARFFRKFGTNAIVLMPPSDGIHSNNEWVSIKGIVDYYKALLTFINSSNKGDYIKSYGNFTETTANSHSTKKWREGNFNIC